MSLTRTVPASVPSLLHSSVPWTPSSAVKYIVPFTRVSCEGDESPGTLMSVRREAAGARRHSSGSSAGLSLRGVGHPPDLLGPNSRPTRGHQERNTVGLQ